MDKVLALLIIFLLPLSVWAMTQVTDSDLSDISSPTGLSINNPSDHIMKSNNDTARTGNNHGDVSKFWQISPDHPSNFGIHLDENSGENREEETARFSFPLMSWNLVLDRLTVIDRTKDLEDLYYKRFTLTGSIADTPGSYVRSDTQADTLHSIAFPDGYKGGANENSPNILDYRPDGRTQLRYYYTGRAGFTIQPNSWVDVKVR
jgi:hypothetical protein